MPVPPFGLYRRQPDGRYASAGVTGRAVTDLHVAGDRLFGVERFNLFVLEPGGQGRLLQADGFTEPTSVMTGPDGNLWFGDALEGLVAVATPDAVATKLTVLQRLVPEGPFNDQFVDMTFDRQGNLWAGEVGAGNSGFYRRSPDGRWTSYLGRFFGELAGTGRYTSVHADAQGNVWAASEGGGLVQVTPEGTLVRYDSRNASLLPASGTDNFVIVGGVASDPDGTIWATTRASPRPLHVRTPDGTWTALPPYTGQGLTFASTAYGRIYVDAFEQKWIVIRNENNLGQIRGLMILDTGGTPTDPSDDVFRFLDEEGGARTRFAQPGGHRRGGGSGGTGLDRHRGGAGLHDQHRHRRARPEQRPQLAHMGGSFPGHFYALRVADQRPGRRSGEPALGGHERGRLAHPGRSGRRL
ncbi:MAG: hypothetical protein KatS3mg043_1508 [Rhodothermaceae bacterium]|nr:MAG: hypothetical protein KatS3mg043_1508 [Rhodothermaceae bacterium]